MSSSNQPETVFIYFSKYLVLCFLLLLHKISDQGIVDVYLWKRSVYDHFEPEDKF